MGKASVIYVIGLSLIITYALMNMNRSSTDSMDSFSEYYGRTMTHNIAVTGANVGTQLLLSDSSYMAARSDSFSGGRYNLRVDSVGAEGNKRITVTASMNLFDNISERSIIRDTVVAFFRRTPFSKYGYFSENEQRGYLTPLSNTPPSTGPMWKVTGDSIFGPAHTNGFWNFSGTPYFNDKVTATTSPNLAPGASPIYHAGYQWGITVSRPPARLNELEAQALSGGKLFNGGSDVGLTFGASGSVNVKIPWNTGATRDTTYATINALAPNGVIMTKSVDVRIKGTYKGQVTVVSRTGSAPLKGNIWIQDNLVAATNPGVDPNSTDIMGLVSERMAYIATTGIMPARTSASTTTVQAAIYCQTGTFAVENWDACGPQGKFYLYGGMTLNASTSFNTISGGVITNGMSKNFKYDPRFMTLSPPFFPFSGKYELLSWWEK